MSYAEEKQVLPLKPLKPLRATWASKQKGGAQEHAPPLTSLFFVYNAFR